MRSIKKAVFPASVLEVKEELERLNAQISQEKVNLENVSLELFSAEGKLESVKAAIEDGNSKLGSVTLAIADEKKKRDDLILKGEETKAEIKEIQERREYAAADLQSAKDELSKVDERIKLQFKNEMESFEVFEAKRKADLEAANKKLNEIAESIKLLEAEKLGVYKDIESRKTIIAGLDLDIDKLQRGTSELRRVKGELSDSLAILTQNSEKLKAEYSDGLIQKDTLNAEIKVLNETLLSMQKEIDEAKMALLRTLGREKKVEEKARKVISLYKEAGIEITI